MTWRRCRRRRSTAPARSTRDAGKEGTSMPNRQRFVVTGALVVVLGLACPSAWAQFASAIEGTVTDPSNAVVPGATVTIANEATGVAQTGHTTSAGYYRFPALPGGVYTLKV